MNTRIKLLALICFSTVLIYMRNLPLLFILFVIISFVSVFSTFRISALKRYLSLCVVALSVLVFQCLLNTSAPLMERVYIGVIASLRIMSLSLLVFLFTESTSVSDIVGALSFFPKQIRLALTISISLIPAILKEAQSIRLVQQSRGYHSMGIFPFIIPLLSRTLIRAEHIAVSLETRGYQI